MAVSYLPFQFFVSLFLADASPSLVLHKKTRVGDEHALNKIFTCMMCDKKTSDIYEESDVTAISEGLSENPRAVIKSASISCCLSYRVKQQTKLSPDCCQSVSDECFIYLLAIPFRPKASPL